LGNTTFRYGNFIFSRTNILFVNDEPGINLLNDKILIAASEIVTRIEFRNDDYPVTIANSKIRDIDFWKWNHNLSNTNRIVNNEFGGLFEENFIEKNQEKKIRGDDENGFGTMRLDNPSTTGQAVPVGILPLRPGVGS
jgi:hypothetical protein